MPPTVKPAGLPGRYVVTTKPNGTVVYTPVANVGRSPLAMHRDLMNRFRKGL